MKAEICLHNIVLEIIRVLRKVEQILTQKAEIRLVKLEFEIARDISKVK